MMKIIEVHTEIIFAQLAKKTGTKLAELCGLIVSKNNIKKELHNVIILKALTGATLVVLILTSSV